MANFDFARQTLPALHADCVRAESYLTSDPTAATSPTPHMSSTPAPSRCCAPRSRSGPTPSATSSKQSGQRELLACPGQPSDSSLAPRERRHGSATATRSSEAANQLLVFTQVRYPTERKRNTVGTANVILSRHGLPGPRRR